eukprot:gnl/Dysnectes_brevis/4424_a5943_839.p1 GENE.gnl/Dysnectes_brevis/4424_a5943_839~~gnl/Dysnectes_brevis/4424_a5943_839.p1  ORF type:complete len:314 (-),score=48.18 gnl/Dysnectes_brevis/4424_a5943_839:104-1045(-)
MDMDTIISEIKEHQKLLPLSVIRHLCEKVKETLSLEPNVVQVPAPVSIVGDIHGQLFDLLELFCISGLPPHTNYLFLGDYVDRGFYSIETICLLFALKVRFPRRITLLRGNHEARQITVNYGFFEECQRKFPSGQADAVWQMITDAFDFLPIAAVVASTFFAVHAGLSPCLHSVSQITAVPRCCEVPHEGLFADLLWSDPTPRINGFQRNGRGIGYLFGGDAVKKFLHDNKLMHILRAHQMCQKGYEVLFDDTLSTVWSAPNYCDRNNLASVLEISTGLERTFNVFRHIQSGLVSGLKKERPPLTGKMAELFS